jgi:prepilin-type processing-associated H-X9-DG protein/prepilin-type N-terminal cleavage/methylation domain-containing protein
MPKASRTRAQKRLCYGSCRRARRGFTLIEIIIVIAVLMLLAGVLFPVFGRVRERGRQATCVSQLRQIGQAIQMYANDNGQFYPARLPGEIVERAECGWAEKIYPYTKSTQVFWCPTYSHGEFRPGCPESDTTEGNTPEALYKWDGSYDLNGIHIPDRPAVHASRIREPSNTILAVDGSGGFVTHASADPGNIDQGIGSWRALSRHNGGGNVSFFDGHVKWLSLEAMNNRSLWEVVRTQ